MPRPASGHGAAKSSSSSIVAAAHAEHNVNMPIPNSAVGCAALLATITDLQIPHFLTPVITSATRATRDRLIIVLFSRLFDAPRKSPSPDAARRNSTGSTGTNKSSSCISHTTKWDEMQRLLTYVYVQATKVAQDMDKVLLDIDVLLRGMDDDLEEDVATGVEMVFRIEGASLRTSWHIPGEQITETQHALLSPTLSPTLSSTFDEEPSTFPVVAVGGTFDHLHAGHKILLSMAAWIAEEKLIVGVTDESLLQKKANKHVLESLDTRMRRVRRLLELFKPGLIYDIVPINDVYGPTGWDPNIQALVVSQETLSGGEAIDRHRMEKSLPPLRTYVIDVISHSSARLNEEDLELMRQTKMSSTFIREWIVKHQRNIDQVSSYVSADMASHSLPYSASVPTVNPAHRPSQLPSTLSSVGISARFESATGPGRLRSGSNSTSKLHSHARTGSNFSTTSKPHPSLPLLTDPQSPPIAN
ncbi:hypothetical protein EWM64_g6361 [Hericium alpestre]|uniref:Cytidyltransferase-like domain-containing protein n=1 Tax=Hericium alpestre TaxID=135208 RepID=A0A4Y9ZTW5_9AGAM|nr:hypothetical protein EWM64_g6361 [Hericium alpestre]